MGVCIATALQCGINALIRGFFISIRYAWQDNMVRFFISSSLLWVAGVTGFVLFYFFCLVGYFFLRHSKHCKSIFDKNRWPEESFSVLFVYRREVDSGLIKLFFPISLHVSMIFLEERYGRTELWFKAHHFISIAGSNLHKWQLFFFW